MSGAFRWLRRLAAVTLVVWAGIWSGTGRWKTCDYRIPSVGNAPVVRVCSSPSITDPGILAVIGIVVVLLWQELAEIGLPGGVSIKRKLERQEETLERQERRAGILESQVTALQMQLQAHATAAAGAQATNTTKVIVSLGDVVDSADTKLARYYEEEPIPLTVVPEEGASGNGQGDGSRRRQPPRSLIEKLTADLATKSQPVKQAELLRAAARLERWVSVADSWSQYQAAGTLPSAETASWTLGLGSDKLNDIVRWRTIFTDELDAVFAARNSIVQGVPLNEEDLDDALKAAARLLSIPHEEFEPLVEAQA